MIDKSHLSVTILSAIGDSYALLNKSRDLKTAIARILPKLGEAASVDRVYVFRNYYNLEGEFCMTYLNEWCRDGVSIQMDNENLIEVPWSIFPELEADLRDDKAQNQLVRDAVNETFVEIMSQQEIVSYLFIPILINNEFWGFIGFDNCNQEELFTPEQVSALHAFASTLGNLIFAKRSLKMVVKNKKKYKQIIANIEAVVFKLDRHLNITYLNGALFKITGRNVQDCIGKQFHFLFFQDGYDKLMKEVENLNLNGGSRSSFRTALKRLNGEALYIRVNLKKIIKGDEFEFFGSINDVHQSQVNFDLLKDSESKLKALFDTVEDVFYSLDFTTRQVLLVSDKIGNFGFRKDELLSDPEFWRKQIIPEDFDEFKHSFETFVKSDDSIFEMEYRIKKLDGSIAWVYEKSVVEYNSEHIAKRIHGRFSDITEKKTKEIQLKHIEDRFRMMVTNLPYSFVLFSEEDLTLQYSNFTFNSCFEINQKEGVFSESFWMNSIVPVESRDDFLSILQSNSDSTSYEILLNTAEGQQWFSLNIQTLPYEMGYSRAISFYNIHKRKLGELELIRLNEAIQAINNTQIRFSMDNDIQETFYLLLESLIGFTDSSFGFIGEVLRDEKGMPYLKSNATSNISWNDKVLDYYNENFKVGMEFRNLDSLFGWVLVNGTMIISNDVSNDPRRSIHGTPAGHPDLKRFLGIPIFKGERFVGMVGLANKEKPYSEEDVNFLKPFLSSYANLIDSLNLNKEKREVEQLKEKSESLYKLLSENIDDIVTLHDLDLKTVYASPSLEKVTGFDPKEFIGKDFLSFFYFESNENLDFTENPQFVIPLIHGVSGKEIKLEMLWKPIYNEQGELTSYLASSRDVTEKESVLEELKRTLEKEIELNQLKTKFISMTSHELRTPLATIQSSVDLIEMISDRIKDVKTHESLLKQIRKVHVQLSRLTTIIYDVILFEKNNEGKIGMNLIVLDLRSLLIQLVFNHFGINGDGAQINLDLGTEPVVLKSDPTLLTHVFRNLIENAIKYTPEGSPKPILKMLLNKESVEIHVIDFGIGIPKSDVKLVLDTFYRASNVKNIKGTGLGLSIVNDLVNNLGGKLTFYSIENQGSTFSVILPYDKKILLI
jgi:PAS domain S-box-containing protein